MNVDAKGRKEICFLPTLGSSSAIAIAMSPPLHPTPKHDVFLSFRGEDTRDNFISHLYAELRRKKIETFIDYRLGRGDEISPALSKAIEESVVYVIVLSEHYASSSWCLDELTKILQCKQIYGRDVIPVFYKVDPSIVRHQRDSYAEAFVKHEQRFKDKVDAWKSALTQVVGLSGWDSQVIRPEHTLVTDIVKDILRKLNRSFLSDSQGMVGIDKHIQQIQSQLHLESMDVRIIGIWGMGGIGKTTIASAIYRKLAAQFSSSCIILNVQQEIERVGVHHLQSKYLSHLLEEDNTSSGLYFSYEQRLKRTKVLLVLDDVNNSDLIESHFNFGQRSRIIVTSRDIQVLKNADADYIYEVKEMNFQDSLQLFSSHAFKLNYPIEAYASLSEKVLNYAKGVPLALKVLGLLLRGRTKEAWESELQKLENLPDLEIFKVFKLSYDGLDEEQKDIFLDIACFYRGQLENVVAQTLDSCGFSAHIGMEVLKDRCLISMSEGRLVMHDLIQEMGHEIVRQQCVNDPGKRSRLWKPNEIYHVLRRNKGTDAIQCILLDMSKIKKVQLQPETFKKMQSVRMIRFYKPLGFPRGSNVILPAFLESLPDNLKFLCWDGFPQRSLPLDFCPENLVILDMRYSHLETLWEEDQDLPNLKRLDLSGSRELIQIPDLSRCPNIEEVILRHCTELVQVYSSSLLSKLKGLWLDGCVGLRSLNISSNILKRSSGLIILNGCRNLEMFSVSNANTGVQSQSSSHARRSLKKPLRNTRFEEPKQHNPPPPPPRAPPRGLGSQFEELSDTFDNLNFAELNIEPMDNMHLLNFKVLREGSPSLFPNLNELCWLDLSYCESLASLPTELFKLKFVKKLYLRSCSNLEQFPEIEETMENLTVLFLDRTAIKELPSSLHHLVGLEELSLHNCQQLEIIPYSIGSLSKLCKLDLTYCESLETIPSSIFKLKLMELNFHGCSMLRTFPEILEPAETFAHIDLTKTAIEELPSSLEYLVGLQTLCLNLCSDLVSLPNSIVNLNRLSQLDCSGCLSLTEIPNTIGCMLSLRELSLRESSIVNLPESIAHLSSLKSLDLSDCKMLENIPQLPPILNQLLAFDCPSIKRVMSNSRLELPSDFKRDTFKFHLTNSQELDATACSNIGAEARLRINEDAYRSVFFCFPGSAVPCWFPFHCRGRSVTMKNDSPYFCNENRLVGFAPCVVLGHVDKDDKGTRCSSFTYRLTFESYGHTHILPNHDEIKNYFYWKGRDRFVVQDQTFLWKYQLDFTSTDYRLFHAHNFTFEVNKHNVAVKECGICPVYTGEKDDNGNFSRFSNNYNEEISGCKAA